MTEKQARFLRAKMLGALMREARLEAGKSLKETASAIGTGSSTLSSYEHGRKSISLPELEILAYHFDVPLHHFLAPSADELEMEREINPEIMVTLRQRMIGAMLRRSRNEKDVSIRQFADQVDMPPSRVSAYERGERPIPIPDLESLLNALEIPMEEFMNKDGPVGEWHRDQRAFEQFTKFSPELRDFFDQPGNEPYLRIAARLSKLNLEDLESVLEAMKGLLA
ncbi:MAG: XRE family transcriptional regulator [Anaerolineales bacterium]|nr:MAG: XRE family transcriptional regulator [Anaerolineales bacterium]